MNLRRLPYFSTVVLKNQQQRYPYTKNYELYVVSYFYHITVHETLAKMLPLNVGSNNPLCKHEYSRDTFSNKKTLPIYSKEYAS